MKIYVLLLLLITTAFFAKGQSVIPLRGDTIKIYRVGGYAELVLQNKTKDTLGVLVNKGGGLTGFIRSKKLNDSTFTIGLDTIVLAGPGGSGSGGPDSLFGREDAKALAARYFNANQQDFRIDSAGLIEIRSLVSGAYSDMSHAPAALILFDSTATLTANGVSWFRAQPLLAQILSGQDIAFVDSSISNGSAHNGWVMTLLDSTTGRTGFRQASGTGDGSNMANADLTADADHTANYNQKVWQLNNASLVKISSRGATTSDSLARLSVSAEPGSDPESSLYGTYDDGTHVGEVKATASNGAYIRSSDGTNSANVTTSPDGSIKINPQGTSALPIGSIMKLADPTNGKISYVIDSSVLFRLINATGIDPYYASVSDANTILSFIKWRDSVGGLRIVSNGDSTLTGYVDLSGLSASAAGISGSVQIKSTTTGLLGNAKNVTADSTTGTLNGDTLTAHKARIDSVQFNSTPSPIAKVGTLNGLGDSFRQPGAQSTAPNDSTDLPLLADTLGVSYNNMALSGSGIRYAIAQMDSLINGPFNTAITWVQSGYNDARASGNNTRTPLKIASASVAGFINHFADKYVTGSDTTTAFMHRYGTWITGLNSTSMGGKTKNGAQTNTLNDSITYDLVGRYIGIVLKGGDGSAIITSIVRVNIDGGSTIDYNTTVADATTVSSVVNTSIPYGLVLDAGSYGKHHIKLVNTEAKIMYVDYFAPISPGARGPYIVNHCIYPVAPAGTQYLAVNNALDSTWLTLPTTVFPSWIVPINDVFDRVTGLSVVDATHPNNTGYRQIFRSEMIQWNARANSTRGIIIADTTGLYFYNKGWRKLIEPKDVFTRSEAAYNFTSYVGVPANASYKVGGIDVWKADVTGKNYLIGNGAGILLSTSTGTGNLFAGDVAGTTCTTCANNMALGNGAMQLATTASANASIGPFSMQSLTTGTQNTGIGFQAVKSNQTGNDNTGIGYLALFGRTGSGGVGIGSGAGQNGTSAAGPTVIGFQAGSANVSGNYPTAIGYQSQLNGTGASNTSVGAFSMPFQTSGTGNVAVGVQALYANGISAAFNYSTALGYYAGKLNGAAADNNTYIGDSTGVTPSLTTITGKRNILLGNGDTLLAPTSNDYMNLGHVIFGDRATQRVSIKANTFGNSYLSLPASTTSYSSLNIPTGTAPNSPIEGDIWKDASHAYVRIGGVSYQIDQQASGFYQTVQSNGTPATQRAKLNYSTDFTVTDNSGNGSTDIGLANATTSGFFQPTSASNTNVASIQLDSASYTIIGNTVTGRFSGTVSATAGVTNTLFHITAPVTNITWSTGPYCGTGTAYDLVTGISVPFAINFSSATEVIANFLPATTNTYNYVITYQYDKR